MIRAAALAALLLPTAALADSLALNLASHHYVVGNFNEHNWGVGYEHDLGNGWVATVGAYKNSFDVMTAYAGGAWRYELLPGVRVGAAAIAMTGYGDHIPVPFMAAPLLEIGPHALRVRAMVVPGQVATLQAVIGF